MNRSRSGVSDTYSANGCHSLSGRVKRLTKRRSLKSRMQHHLTTLEEYTSLRLMRMSSLMGDCGAYSNLAVSICWKYFDPASEQAILGGCETIHNMKMRQPYAQQLVTAHATALVHTQLANDEYVAHECVTAIVSLLI